MSRRFGLRQRRRLDAPICKWHKLWLFIDTDHSCANTYSDADTNTNTNTNAHTNSNTNTNAHTDANPYPHTYSYPNANSYPHTYSYAGGQKRKAWDCL